MLLEGTDDVERKQYDHEAAGNCMKLARLREYAAHATNRNFRGPAVATNAFLTGKVSWFVVWAGGSKVLDTKGCL